MDSKSGVEDLLPGVRELKAQGKASVRMDGEKRRYLAKEIGLALADNATEVQPLLTESQFLPGPILADGISAAWPKFDPSARAAVIKWLGTLNADKRATVATRLGILLLGGSDVDRERASDILLLAPETKDVLSRLATELLGADGSALDRLRLPEGSAGLALAGRLLKAAVLPSVAEYRRAKVIQLAVGWLLSRSGALSDSQDVLDLARQVRAQLTGLTAEHLTKWLEARPGARELFDASLPSGPVGGAVPTSLPETRPTEPARPAAPVPSPVSGSPTKTSARAEQPVRSAPPVPTVTKPPCPDEADAITTLIAKRLDVLRRDVRDWERVQNVIEAGAARTATLEGQVSQLTGDLDEARGESARVQERSRVLAEGKSLLTREVEQQRAEIERLRHESEAARGIVDRTRSEAEAQRSQWDGERASLNLEIEQLNVRVVATAERRLEELRNRLAAAVSRARRHVPERQTTLSTDQAVVVLARFYEVLEALEDNGVALEEQR